MREVRKGERCRKDARKKRKSDKTQEKRWIEEEAIKEKRD